MDVNYNYLSADCLGASFVQFLDNRNKKEKDKLRFTITFTKGKTEIDCETINRINVTMDSAIIHYKDGKKEFINLINATTITED